MVAIGLYLVDRWVAFAPFAILSVGFNEKIALVFVIWLVMRCVLFPEDRAKLGAPAARRGGRGRSAMSYF